MALKQAKGTSKKKKKKTKKYQNHSKGAKRTQRK